MHCRCQLLILVPSSMGLFSGKKDESKKGGDAMTLAQALSKKQADAVVLPLINATTAAKKEDGKLPLQRLRGRSGSWAPRAAACRGPRRR